MMKIVLLLFAIILAGCASSRQWPPEPEEVHLGEVSCAKCRMIISDDRFGAQLHEQGKEVQQFDDFGCLLNMQQENVDRKNQVIFVRSFNDGEWLSDSAAFFVVSSKILSPMGHGIAAFPTQESAELFAGKNPDSKVYSRTGLIPAVTNNLRTGPQERSK